MDYLSANTEMDACIGLVEHFWEKGYPVPVDFRQDLLEKPQVGYFIQNLLAQKAVFDRVGTFNSDIYAGQGMDWFARARDAKAKIGIVNEVLLRKRWHDTNIALHHFSFNTTFFRILRQSVKRRRGGTTK